MEVGDLKEKAIVSGFFLGVFLPLRLLFVEYVSDHWLGSLGLISGLMILLVILFKKGKLGKIGKIFEKHTKKMVFGKTGKFVIILSMLSLTYFGSTIILMERGNTTFSEDKSLFYDVIIENKDMTQINQNNLKNFHTIYESENRMISTFDYAFSITYSIMNEFSNGWLEHIYFVLMVEQIEMIGIFIFTRLAYKPVVSIHNI